MVRQSRGVVDEVATARRGGDIVNELRWGMGITNKTSMVERGEEGQMGCC